MNSIVNEKLTQILESQVLSEEIHTLLKQYKEDNKELIRLSGNKTQLIDNLLLAIEENIIPKAKILELIQDSEEYGDQYIYLYCPLNSGSHRRYSDGDAIKRSLIPANEVSKFPKLMKLPEKLEWIDFRAPNRGKKNSWLAKLYDKKVREVKENESINYSDGTRIVTYKKLISRLIYIIYWNGSGLMEIKVSRTTFDSHKSLDNSLKQVRKKIAPTISIATDFKIFDLSNTINNVLKNSSVNKNIYTLQGTKLEDTQKGTATLRTFGEDEEDLFADDSRKKAIDAYIGQGGTATSIVLTFLKDGSNGLLSKDINVILGRDAINQIIIPSNITPQEYNYVRKKIADYN